MKVIASALGFYGRLIQPDETFDVPDDEEESSWFAPVKQEPASKLQTDYAAKGKAKDLLA